jgi:hypothetical protein
LQGERQQVQQRYDAWGGSERLTMNETQAQLILTRCLLKEGSVAIRIRDHNGTLMHLEIVSQQPGFDPAQCLASLLGW